MKIQKEIIVPDSCANERLDKAMAALFPDYSRSCIQTWIKDNQVKVNGKSPGVRDKLKGGEHIVIDALIQDQTSWSAEGGEKSALMINDYIIYEDDSILIINKPVGLVVHPGTGNSHNTLANGLLQYCSQLSQLPRAGIVHRLDKDTSGLLIIAKTLEAQTFLTAEIQARKIHREYIAIVNGVLISGGTVNEPIGRHPKFRQKKAVMQNGKPSVTHYRIIERFKAHTLLKIILETGRTHQIRVHMAHRGNPLVGDKTYGARPIVPKEASPELIAAIRGFTHQALHAKCLRFSHPVTHTEMCFEAPVPAEILKLLELLKN